MEDLPQSADEAVHRALGVQRHDVSDVEEAGPVFRHGTVHSSISIELGSPDFGEAAHALQRLQFGNPSKNVLRQQIPHAYMETRPAPGRRCGD